MFSWLKSRKFFIAVFFGVNAIVMCWFQRMSGGECATVLCALSGLYKAANVLDSYWSQQTTIAQGSEPGIGPR